MGYLVLALLPQGVGYLYPIKMNSVPLVTTGPTIGMLIANIPAAYAGQWLVQRVDPKKARVAACVVFILMGIGAVLYPIV